MSTERFAKWGFGKPVGFVVLARQAAMEAENLGTLTNWMLAGEHLEILPPPPSAKRMLEMYRDHRTVQLAVGAVLFGGDDEGWAASQFYQDGVDEQRQFTRLSSLSAGNWRKSGSSTRNFWKCSRKSVTSGHNYQVSRFRN
jgi:hypothetical protein